MKQSMFSKQSQKGFTLLELLIVVTIIAILSVGAILAYEGLTDKAQSSSAANNTASADQAIRNYRAVAKVYPNQWDHLVANDATGSALDFVADETYQVLARVNATALSSALIEAFEEVGIEELQARNTSETADDVEPNLQHSEGAVSDGTTIEIELEEGDFPTRLVVIPTATSSVAGAGGVMCAVQGGTFEEIRTTDAEGDAIDSNVDDANIAQAYMTKINDNIGEDECHLVVALGFGHDAAHSTVNSNVAIAAAPAFVGNAVKPADNYARYIGLFDVAIDRDGDNVIQANEVYGKAKLIGLIDPEGKVIDENVAAANDDTAN